MRIGLVAYAYPPFPASGSLRAEKVARALQRGGHDVFVVTSRLPGEGKGPRIQEPGLQVHPVACWPNPRHAYLRLKRLARAGRSAPPADGASPARTPAAGQLSASIWKRAVISLLWFPDDLQGFIPPALLQLVRVSALDQVYTTAPPHSSHLVGAVYKSLTRTPWIAEYRDPWTGPGLVGKSASHRTRTVDRVEARLERWCLRRADGIVTVSEGIRELLLEKLPSDLAPKVQVVRNGIERIWAESPAPTSEEPYRIVHLGNLYLRRDPRAFLEALASVRRDLRLDGTDVELHLIGENREFRGVSVEAMAAELGIADWLRFRGWIPHSETGAVIRGADLLLLFAQGQPRQVPNKLYEYLGTGRPIFAVADEEGETARMLREVGGHYLVTQDEPGAIAATLRRAWAERGTPVRSDPAVLESWRTDRQMEQLLEAIRARPASGKP